MDRKIGRGIQGRFTKELVLVVLDLDKKVRIEVDTSDYAIGFYLWSMRMEGED